MLLMKEIHISRICIYYSCMALCILLSLSSCIQGEISGICPPEGNTLQVLFTHDGTEEMDAGNLAALSKAVLFVYDEHGRFITYREIGTPRLDETYQTGLALDAGMYRFIVWFNPDNPYAFSPVLNALASGHAKDSQQFLLQVPGDRIINENETTLPLLLYGNKEAVISNETGNLVVIPVTRNTNTVNISVAGLLPDDHAYRFEITDDNGIYTFDNEFYPCASFKYIKNVRYESGILGSSLTVLKLSGSRPGVSLKILDATTGKVLFPNATGITASLVRLLELVYPGNNFDKRHNYNIDILFVGTDILVNGWKLVPSDNVLIPE